MMPVGVEWKDPQRTLRAEEAWGQENPHHPMPKSGLG